MGLERWDHGSLIRDQRSNSLGEGLEGEDQESLPEITFFKVRHWRVGIRGSFRGILGSSQIRIPITPPLTRLQSKLSSQ